MTTEQKFFMILDVFQRKGLLRVHKQNVVLKILHAKDVHLLACFPAIVVAIRSPARTGSTVLLHVGDFSRTI